MFLTGFLMSRRKTSTAFSHVFTNKSSDKIRDTFQSVSGTSVHRIYFKLIDHVRFSYMSFDNNYS